MMKTYHAKFYSNIRTGSSIFLTLFFGFGRPPLLASKAIERVGSGRARSEVTSYAHFRPNKRG